MQERIPIVPLYFAKPRPVVRRGDDLIVVDDDRMRLEPGEEPVMMKVRFRTLGCYPVSSSSVGAHGSGEGIFVSDWLGEVAVAHVQEHGVAQYFQVMLSFPAIPLQPKFQAGDPTLVRVVDVLVCSPNRTVAVYTSCTANRQIHQARIETYTASTVDSDLAL